jgi:uncharacterized protein YjdB
MTRRRSLFVAALCAAVASTPVALGCFSSDAGRGTGPGNAHVASWNGASLAAPGGVVPDPTVSQMIALVSQARLLDNLGKLSGRAPVTVGGTAYTITTRWTASGTPIAMATQYAYERFKAAGLVVGYQSWTRSGQSGRNVVAERTGTVRPSEIVLVTAHIDDVSSGELAPGADDDATGCEAVMTVAELMASGNFERTVRFVLFTGEEQQSYGSAAYASSIVGQNVVGDLQLDMLGWDAIGEPSMRIYTRRTTSPGYAADRVLADAMAGVIAAYGLPLVPLVTASGPTDSDHASFWNEGIAAVMAIEEDASDFNPYWHTPQDDVDKINLPYFTNFVKAVVGTAAHLAVPAAPCAPLAAPGNLSAAASSSTGIDLGWSPVPDAVGYRVYRSAASGGPYAAVGSTALTTYADIGLVGGTTYYYVVRSFGTGAAACESANSNEASATTAAPIPAPTATLSASPATIGQGQTATLTWRTTNATTATIGGLGAVALNGSQAVTPSLTTTYQLTATGAGGTATATAAVTVTAVPSVASVTVAPASATVAVGRTVQLTATAKDAAGNVLAGRVFTWSSSSTSRATVSTSGLVTGVSSGSAVTIRASTGGRTGSASVTVVRSTVASVTVAPATVSVGVGQTVQLSATAKDAGGNVVAGQVFAWSTSSSSRATVSSTGLVKGVSAGSVTIRATTSGVSGSSAVSVTSVPVASVTVTPATATVAQFGTLQLTATLRDANGNVLTGKTVSWASSAAAVATVSSSGRVTAVAAGAATISATSGGVTGSASVTVTAAPVAVVTVTPTPASVEAGATLQLTATLTDASGRVLTGRTVTWASSAESVATVGSTGVVSGVVGGSATISAASEGRNGSAAITVTAPGAAVVLVGAGDVSDCVYGDVADATGLLLDGIPGTVFMTGDGAHMNGSLSEYKNCYAPAWGRHKARTRPAPGNHDYWTSGAAGYFGYFGSVAGPTGLGYYSYDLGSWHIIALNSLHDYGVGIGATSAQGRWLLADLAANTKRCILAYWHYPRFSSGNENGGDSQMQAFWDPLYQAGATIVVTSHEHLYERFAPQTPSGVADPVRGIRAFIVGTGGAENYGIGTVQPNSEVRSASVHGVLKFTLSEGSYTWEFIPIAGDTFRDSGIGTCNPGP